MLKPRVIAQLLFHEGVLHRTKRFRADYRYTKALVGLEVADEVVAVNVTPGAAVDDPVFWGVIDAYDGFMPLTVACRIRTPEDVRFALQHGADKVLCSARHQERWRDISEKFGAQVLMAGVSYTDDANDAVAQAVQACENGAGEILLTSIDRDGSLLGYDLDTLRAVVAAIPPRQVVAAGGCGTGRHMAEAIAAGAGGAATANIFHIADAGLAAFKRQIAAAGLPVRGAAA